MLSFKFNKKVSKNKKYINFIQSYKITYFFGDFETFIFIYVKRNNKYKNNDSKSILLHIFVSINNKKYKLIRFLLYFHCYT